MLKVLNYVWENRSEFVVWPRKSLLFWLGCVRRDKHTYPDRQSDELKRLGIPRDARSNGPAIAAFLVAGGQRPLRMAKPKGWSIHHIYDGQFPALGRKRSLHAVKDGNHFTESAGLVAVHPVADALADEVPYFAWLLRHEAYCRFGYDPDEVFTTS